MPTNDLIEFLKRETNEITREYSRIQSRVREDPGTAGDQSEENWASVFRLWLPAYYHVVTKGRILSIDGTAGPQVDLLVLSPSYPRYLLDKKHYLAGGVVAAFECKTTLRSGHLREFFENCVKIRKLFPPRIGTPARELHPQMLYGLLAHSHEWQSPSSRPEENVERAISELDLELVKRPVEMPDLICVANLGVWQGIRSLMPGVNRPGRFTNETANYLEILSAYVGHLHQTQNQTSTFTPIGALLSTLFHKLSRNDMLMRELESYFRQANISGSGSGLTRRWSADVLSQELKNALQVHRLKNGVPFDEWSMGPY